VRRLAVGDLPVLAVLFVLEAAVVADAVMRFVRLQS